MYTPHMIALVNAVESATGVVTSYVTFFDKVFLDKSKSRRASNSGLADADSATLFIPFSSIGEDAQGNAKEYRAPIAFSAASDKSKIWTLQDGGASSGSDCYFIEISDKGDLDITNLTSFSVAKRTYDHVYAVTSINIRDFGSADMRHFQVGGK